MMENVRSKVGASLLIGSVEFLIALTLAEILYPNYSLSANPLSDLGAGFFQPSSNIFNVSVIIFGLLVILGAYFAMRAFHSKSLVVVMLLAGIGIAGVGFFIETILVPHLIFSFMAFFFSGVAAVLSFRLVTSRFRYFGAALGMFTLVALVLFIVGVDFGLGHGGIQRMVVYPALIWYIGFGAHIIEG